MSSSKRFSDSLFVIHTKFVTKFCSLFSFAFFYLYVTKSYVSFASEDTLIPLSLIFAYFALLNHYFLIPKHSFVRRLAPKYLLYIFILTLEITLLPLSLVDYTSEEFTNLLELSLCINIALGIFIFATNRQKADSVQIDREHEKGLEIARAKTFESNHRRLQNVPILGKMCRSIYKEGLLYILLIFITILVSTAVRIYFIPHAAIDNDEGYTYALNLGFLEYHDLGTSITGATYSRTPIYNFFTSLVLLLSNNPLFSLRLFNVLFFMFVSPFIYVCIRNLFSKKIAIIAFILINLCWYLNATLLAGRSYTFSIVFSFFALYWLIKAILEAQKGNLPYKSVLLGILLMTLTFFEGHITATYHLLPLLFVTATIIFSRVNYRQKLIILGIFTAFCFLLCCYIFVINPSYGYFIYKIINIRPDFKFITDFSSLFSYYSSIGIFVIVFTLGFSLFVTNRNSNANRAVFFFSLFCVYVYGVHAVVIPDQTKFFIYLSDLIIPLIICFSFWLSVILSYKIKAIVPALFLVIIVIVGTSCYNMFGVFNQTVSWEMNGQPFENMARLAPKGATILTDQPLVGQILSRDYNIYTIFRWINDAEMVDVNLNQDVYSKDDPYATTQFSTTEKKRFKEFIFENIETRDIISVNQLYSLYSGSPLVMNEAQINAIIENSPNKEVYLLFTHNAYDKRARERNIELYDYVFSHIHIVKEYDIVNNSYNDQPAPSYLRNVLTLAKISK